MRVLLATTVSEWPVCKPWKLTHEALQLLWTNVADSCHVPVMSLAVVSASQSYDVFALQFNRSVLRASRHMYRSSYLLRLRREESVQAQELHLHHPRHNWEPCIA